MQQQSGNRRHSLRTNLRDALPPRPQQFQHTTYGERKQAPLELNKHIYNSPNASNQYGNYHFLNSNLYANRGPNIKDNDISKRKISNIMIGSLMLIFIVAIVYQLGKESYGKIKINEIDGSNQSYESAKSSTRQHDKIDASGSANSIQEVNELVNGQYNKQQLLKALYTKEGNKENIDSNNHNHKYTDKTNKKQKDHVVSIPLVPYISVNQNSCQKTKQYKLQQSIKNIKVFQMLKSRIPSYDAQPTTYDEIQNNKISSNLLLKSSSFYQYFIQILPLYIVKHHKFTSPSCSDEGEDDQKQSMLAKIWQNVKKQFFGFNNYRDKNAYDNIERILNKDNTHPYRSQGKYITFTSDLPIKLSLITLKFTIKLQIKQLLKQIQLELTNNHNNDYNNQQYSCTAAVYNKVLHIYGILAYDSIIVNRNTLESVFVKKTVINLQEHVFRYKNKMKTMLIEQRQKQKQRSMGVGRKATDQSLQQRVQRQFYRYYHKSKGEQSKNNDYAHVQVEVQVQCDEPMCINEYSMIMLAMSNQKYKQSSQNQDSTFSNNYQKQETQYGVQFTHIALYTLKQNYY